MLLSIHAGCHSSGLAPRRVQVNRGLGFLHGIAHAAQALVLSTQLAEIRARGCTKVCIAVFCYVDRLSLPRNSILRWWDWSPHHAMNSPPHLKDAAGIGFSQLLDSAALRLLHGGLLHHVIHPDLFQGRLRVSKNAVGFACGVHTLPVLLGQLLQLLEELQILSADF